MRTFSKMLLLIVAAATATLAIACSGSDNNGGDRTSSKDAGGQKSSALFVSNPVAALGASADRFEQQVQSLNATFSFDMSMAEFKVGAVGDFAYQSPDQLHMNMKLSGGGGAVDFSQFGSFEILALGDKIYMKVPFLGDGWFVMSFADLGVNAASFKDLLQSHSPLDFRALLQSAGANVEDLGSEDGQRHLRAKVNVKDLLDALMKSFGSNDTFGNGTFPSLYGPMALDMWISEDTMLPSRFQAKGQFDAGDNVANFSMTMEFKDYNGSVDIPTAPSDAKSFSDISGGVKLGSN